MRSLNYAKIECDTALSALVGFTSTHKITMHQDQFPRFHLELLVHQISLLILLWSHGVGRQSFNASIHWLCQTSELG